MVNNNKMLPFIQSSPPCDTCFCSGIMTSTKYIDKTTLNTDTGVVDVKTHKCTISFAECLNFKSLGYTLLKPN